MNDASSESTAARSSRNTATVGDYLTKRDVAALIQVSTRTVDNLMARGILPFLKLSERNVRFSRSGVDSAMAALRVGGGK